MTQNTPNLATQAKYDSQSLSDLYRLYFPKVYNYVRWRIYSKEAAEDVVSEIFLKVAKFIATYSEKYAISTWIFTIARNTIVDYFRKQPKAGSIIDLDSVAEFTDDITATEQEISVAQLLASIPKDDHELLRLRYLAEMPIPEIALLLGITTKGVYSRLERLEQELGNRFSAQQSTTVSSENT